MRQDSRKRLVIAVILAAILVIAGIVANWLMSWGEPHHPTLAEISKDSGIEFPSSARLIGADDYSFLDVCLYAAVEMKRDDVQQFLSSLQGSKKICQREELRYATGSLPKKRQWWKPESISKSKAMKVNLPKGSYDMGNEVELLISLDHPARSVVYIFWSAG